MNCALILCVLLLSPDTNAQTRADYSGKLVTRRAARQSGIAGLKWVSDQAAILLLPFGFATRPVAIIEGEFHSDDRALVLNTSGVTVDPRSRRFTISIPLTGPATPFDLQAVNIFGQVQTENFAITTADWADILGAVLAKSNRPQMRFTAGMGVTSLAYQQDRVDNYTALALTAKGSALYRITARWDLLVAGYITAQNLSASRFDTNVRFLGVNFRVGYSLPILQAPWRMAILAGGYYTTMTGTNHLFGYQGVVGPQIYPSLQREFSTGSTLSAYAKYSPVSQSGSMIDLKSREWAVGLSWNNPLDAGGQLSLSIDIADLKLIGERTSAQSQSFTVGAGYSW